MISKISNGSVFQIMIREIVVFSNVVSCKNEDHSCAGGDEADPDHAHTRITRMAPNLAPSEHESIYSIISSGKLIASQLAIIAVQQVDNPLTCGEGVKYPPTIFTE